MKFQNIIGICLISLFFTGCGSGSSDPQPSKLQGWGASSSSMQNLSTDQQLEERVANSGKIINNLAKKVRQEDIKNYNFQNIIDSLKEDINVTGVEVTSDDLFIYDKTGGRLNIPLVSKSGNELLDITKPIGKKSTVSTNIKAKKYLLKRKQYLVSKKDIAPDYSEKKALIYTPYLGNWGERDTIIACGMKYFFEKINYKVDFVTDKNINKIIDIDDSTLWLCNIKSSVFEGEGIDKTIGYINKLHEYSAVYMGTHGSENSIHTGIVLDDLQLKNTTVNLFSKSIGIEFGRNFDDTWLRTGFGSSPNLVIKSEFFKAKSSNYFKNSLFQVDSCKTGRGNKFSSSVINAGAGVFIGFTDSITVQASIDFTVPLYEKLSEGQSLQEILSSTDPLIKRSWVFGNAKPSAKVLAEEDNTYYLIKPLDTPPIIMIIGKNPVTIEVGDRYIDKGATATDNLDAEVQVFRSGAVDIQTAGSYTITYTATDNAGKTAKATRTVIVEESVSGIFIDNELSVNISFSNSKLTAIFNKNMKEKYFTTGNYSPEKSYWNNPRTFSIDFNSYTPGGKIILRADGFHTTEGGRMKDDAEYIFPN